MSVSLTERQVDTLAGLIEVIETAASLKADIKEWKKRKAEADESVARIGKAGEIDRLHAAAEKRDQSSREALAAAKAEAERITAKGNADVAAREAAFKAEREKWLAEKRAQQEQIATERQQAAHALETARYAEEEAARVLEGARAERGEAERFKASQESLEAEWRRKVARISEAIKEAK